MKPDRCGECDKCIEEELYVLGQVEHGAWLQAKGDTEHYLDWMSQWVYIFGSNCFADLDL